MEDFVAAVKVFSQDKNWTKLKEYLNDSGALILKNGSKIDSAITAFDPVEHTLAIIGLIFYKVSLPNAGDFDLLFDQFKQIVDIGDKTQVQISVEKFCHIGHVITKTLVEQKKAFRGILPFIKGIEKLQKHDTELTSLHADLTQLCLAAKCMKPALKFLDKDITQINTEEKGTSQDVDVKNQNDQFDSKSFLLYYYYGGMIYLALKKYDQSLYFFQNVLTTPAMVVSHIMLEAYRKYVLVSIFLHGRVLPLPKYTSQVVQRYLKENGTSKDVDVKNQPLSQAYTELAESYSSLHPDQLRAVANKHQAVYQRDENVGLVKQVISSLTMKRIQKLTKTFLTLSLADMATRVNLRDASEAETYLLQMEKGTSRDVDVKNQIEDGTIYATIDQHAGMVSFHNKPERYNTPKMLHNIDTEMRKCLKLTEHLNEMDQELQINPHYVQKIMNMQHLDDAGKVDEMVTTPYS